MKIFQTIKITKLIRLLTYFLEMKIILIPNMVRKARRMQELQEQIDIRVMKSINDYWLFLSSLRKEQEN